MTTTAPTTTDRWDDGYRAARRFYEAGTAQARKTATTWGDPSRQDVANLIRRHWPALAADLDALAERTTR